MNRNLWKIVVFQTWGIGDMILTTPMLGALRHEFPDAQIKIVAGSEGSAQVVRGSYLVDDVKIFDTRTASIMNMIRLLYFLKRERFSIAIVSTRISVRIGQMLRLFCVAHRICGDSVRPRKWGYTDWVPVIPGRSRVESNMEILRTVFPDAQTGQLYFHVNNEYRVNAAKLWKEWGLDSNIVIGIHPGSDPKSGKCKRIPVRLCRQIIAEILAERPQVRFVIFFGPMEQDLLAAFSEADKRVILSSGLPLQTVAALIGKTKVFIAGDTGLGHIAAAMGVPVITVAGPTDVSSTRPWGEKNIVVSTDDPPECMPCYDTVLYNDCRMDFKCIKQLDLKSKVMFNIAKLI